MRERGSSYLFFSVAIAAFGGFLFGYHTGIISGALLFLTSTFHLSTFDQGIVVSMVLVGGMVGAGCAGMLADRVGRQRTMALTASLFILGAAVIMLARGYHSVLVGRFISGVGVGIASLVAPLYLAEISPPHFRGRFVSIHQLSVTLGILFAFVINFLFSAHGEWRWMFTVGIFPALLQIGGLFFIPETPAWLLKQKREAEALAVLTKLRRDREWKEHIEEMERSASFHKHVGWRSLLQRKYVFVLFIGLTLSACQQLTGINTVIYYAPTIFQLAGMTSATGAILATVGLGSINVLMTLFASWIVDRVGRRRLLLIGIAGMGVSLTILSIAFFMHIASIGSIALICLTGFIISFALGLGPVSLVVISEIYPLRIRAKAMTLAIFINWLCNYIVSLTFLDWIAHLGQGGTFLLYAAISVLSFFFVLHYIPETKGRSLEEIERELIR